MHMKVTEVMHKPYNSETTLRISIMQGSLLSEVCGGFFGESKTVTVKLRKL